MSRYGFEESIRDGATLPLHFEPWLIELHIDKEGIDEAYATSPVSSPTWTRVNRPRPPEDGRAREDFDRVRAICADVAKHFVEKVEPNGFKAMVVTFDQETCLLYKDELDKHLAPEASDVVISVSGKEKDDDRQAPRSDRDAEESSTGSATRMTRYRFWCHRCC
ncbi:MAG: hypothetical protein R3B13_40365 [Polyangiaceae bacterium]